ncbi:MAG: hypothetical protein M1819_006882 [Sarea resinae]|nr:MAG: hypothetical protein M1819_006882 [Sarea resinae]
MRAIRYHGRLDVRLEEIPEPVCGVGEVKIRPSFVGICGTDLHEYLAGPYFAPQTPHPVTGDVMPITLGHEFSGIVEEVGEDVNESREKEGLLLKKGDRVTIKPTVFCGKCEACGRGLENCCSKGGFVGLSGGGGGMSEHVVLPSSYVVKLPDNVSLEVGALAEPLAVAWHAVDASPLHSTSSVLVLGGGPIGLAVLQSVKARGAKKIIVSEIAPARQSLAKKYGAHHVLDPRTYDLVAISKQLCGGEGPDIVFDCAGVPASLVTACTAAKARGTVVNVAMWEQEVPFNPNMLVFYEKTYVAVLGYLKKDFDYVMEALASGILNPEAMITRKIQMAEVVEKGFKALIAEKDKYVKILVEV